MLTKVPNSLLATPSAGVTSNVAVLKGLNTDEHSAAILLNDRQEGIFTLKDYSGLESQVTAANDLGLIIRSTHDTNKVWAAPLHKEIILNELGADPTGAASSDAAFAAALGISKLRGYLPITLTPGEYKLSGSYTSLGPHPIRGTGESSAGGTLPYRGVRIYHNSNSDFLTFNGGDTDYAGTGGCLEKIWVQKQTGYNGGVVCQLIAQSDVRRPGEFKFQDFLVGASGSGSWSKAIHVDGTACNTPGSRGVRTITFDNVRLTGTSIDNQTVHFKQATHVKGFIICEGAGGSGLPGISFEDYTQNVDLHVREANVVIGSALEGPGHMIFYGKINDLLVLDDAVTGAFFGIRTGSLTNNSSNFTTG